MARQFLHVLSCLAVLSSVHAYFLVSVNDLITTQRLDPIVNPGTVSGHVHSVFGGSNFGFITNTSSLRESECTSMPIKEDKSNYWFPHLYFQWANGSFTSLSGGVVVSTRPSRRELDYLFDNTPGTTTAFPDDFRMISGDPTLRTYNASSYAQQAVTFLCLDFSGTTTRFNALPNQACPSGVRAQINFPMCWDGKNTDSPDHKSHVAFPSGGPDSGSCSDPNYPVTLPRIFMEVYWDTNSMDAYRSEAMNTTQPYVYSYGDRTGYGYHADFINGWQSREILQNVVDKCTCNEYGNTDCCVDQGLFTIDTTSQCRITDSIDEQTLGTLDKLPGNNPVQEEGKTATIFTDPVTPPLISPVYVYTSDSPTQTGSVVTPAETAAGAASAGATASASSSSSSGSSGQDLAASASLSSASAAAATGASDSGSGSDSGSTGQTVAASSSSSSSAASAAATGASDSGSGSDSGSTGQSVAASSSSSAASAAATGVSDSGSTGQSVAASSSLSAASAAATGASDPGSTGQSVAASSSSSAASSASTGVSTVSGSGSNSSSSDSSSSGSSASGSTCKKRKRDSEPNLKRRALHKARLYHDSNRRFTPNAY